jgi:hypothetical protein
MNMESQKIPYKELSYEEYKRTCEIMVNNYGYPKDSTFTLILPPRVRRDYEQASKEYLERREEVSKIIESHKLNSNFTPKKKKRK